MAKFIGGYSFLFECRISVKPHCYLFSTDIGSNLTDAMYQGIYHGSKKHEGDLLNVLNRAWSGDLEKIVITGTSLKESEQAVEIANSDGKSTLIY